MARASGLSRPTLYQGVRELESGQILPGRVRRKGGGRKTAEQKYPQLAALLETLVEPTTRGDPMSPLRWTTKSTRRLAESLAAQGIEVSHRVVAEMLTKLHYSLQANAKSIEEGSDHPDRDAQFEHINKEVKAFMRRGEPRDFGGHQEEGIGGSL